MAKATPYSHMLRMTPDTDEAKARKANLLARKVTQVEEGRAAMADYRRDQQVTIARTAKLRALRLARQSEPADVKPPKAKAARKKKSA
jgi:hypothetical protein